MKEVSMSALFPACINVLNARLMPLHYKTLTQEALKTLGENPNREWLHKDIENVREKLLGKGKKYGTGYTGHPLHAGILQHWLQSTITLDVVRIPGSALAGQSAVIEAIYRYPHMITKNPLANPHSRIMALSKGLVIQEHVTRWVRSQYGFAYRDPDNAGRWDKPCSHDFQLALNGHTFLVDVAGTSRNGRHEKAKYKQATDIHVLADIDGCDCVITGITRGSNFTNHMEWAHIFSPQGFVVWLNCCKHGINYKDDVVGGYQRWLNS
jgi:hypothetical protein